MTATITKQPRHLREAENTYGLPAGEAIRRELVKWFRLQRKAVMTWVKTGEIEQKDLGGLVVWEPIRAVNPLPLRIRGSIPHSPIETKKEREIPGVMPLWDAFGLGDLPMSERMTPKLEAIWDTAGQKFTSTIGLDPDSWQVTNPKTQEAIQRAALDFCAETNATTSMGLNAALDATRAALSTGIIEHGEGVRELTKRIGKIFDGAEKYRARRIATSEASRAVHSAQEMQAEESEIVTGWRWLISANSCELCKTVARRAPAVKLGQAFAIVGDNPHYSTVRFPPLHPNCCLPETPIVAPIGIAGVKAHYDGPVVRVVLSDGTDVTITPNHMLLTVEGFATASSLVEGDEIVRYCGVDRMGGSIPDDDYQPTPIEDVVRSLAVSLRVTSVSMPVAPEYLHGDGAFCHGDVNVIASNRLLNHYCVPLSLEPFLNGPLCLPNVDGVSFDSEGDLIAVLFALRNATDGGMGGLRESKARLRSRSRVAVSEGIGVRPGTETSFQKSAANQRAADAESLRQCQLRFPGKIATAKIVFIDHDSLHYSGPVYDVQTALSLYYIGNGIVSSNCRCTVNAITIYDEQPKWAATLHQPEPEEQDYEPNEKPEAVKPRPKQPKTAKPKPAAPVKIREPKPNGPPVSGGVEVTVKTPALERAVRSALDLIDGIHGDGNLPKIPIVETKSGTSLGRLKVNGNTLKPIDITIHKAGDRPRMTTAHEMGHYLDWSGIKSSHRTATGGIDYRKDPRFKQLIEALDKSEAGKALAKLETQHSVQYTQGTITSQVKIDKKYLAYLRSDEEVWARAYSQYIATKSQDPGMMAELEHTIRFGQQRVYTEQWQHDDFKPIVKEFDRLFKSLGWIK